MARAASCRTGIDAAIQTARQFPHPLRATDFAAEWFKPWLDMTADELASRRLGLWAAFVDTLFAQLTIEKIAIENSARDWPAYYARVEDALGF